MTIRSGDIAGVRPLREATAWLDDLAALKRLWGEDGYLFFRDVLYADDMADIRRTFLDILIGRGVVDRDAREPICNGTDLADLPAKLDALIDSRVWERLAVRPAFTALARRVLGDEPLFLPMTEYRVMPPKPADRRADAMLFRHQAGLLNHGIPCRIFWVPVFDMDAPCGGMVTAQVWQGRGFAHDPDDHPKFAIPDNVVPDADWRRSDFRAGDVLIFDMMTPHSGIGNSSDRFRARSTSGRCRRRVTAR